MKDQNAPSTSSAQVNESIESLREALRETRLEKIEIAKQSEQYKLKCQALTLEKSTSTLAGVHLNDELEKKLQEKGSIDEYKPMKHYKMPSCLLLDEQIKKLIDELHVFRQKKSSKAIFEARLCCFEPMPKEKGISFDDNNVQFAGK